MRIIGDNLYLEVQDLLDLKVPEDTVRHGMRRHDVMGRSSWAYIELPELPGIRLIDYQTIPTVTKEKYNLPSRHHFIERGRRGELKQRIHPLPADENFYIGHPHTKSRAKHFARYAAWLRFLGLQTTASARRLGLGLQNLGELYEAAIDVMGRDNLPGFSISNPNVLGKRVREFKEADYPDNLRLLVPGKTGNNNARKIGNPSPQLDLLIHLHSNGRKLSIEQTYQLYTAKARELVEKGEWPAKSLVSLGTIKNVLSEPEVRQMWALRREGEKAFRQQYERKISRVAASFPNAKWEMDGSKLNLVFINPEATNERDRWVFYNLFVVMDEHSQRILGWSIGTSEDRIMVLEALRMACQLGHRPHQLVSDRGAANMSAQMKAAYQVVAKHFTPAEAGRASSKSRVESLFDRLGQKVLKHLPGYTGGNITTKSNDAQANPELLRLEKREGHLITTHDAQAFVGQIIETWNRAPLKSGKSPLELYETGMKRSADRQLAFTKGHDVEAFYIERTQGHGDKARVLTHTFGTHGLQLQVDGERFYFDVENHAERVRLHLKTLRLRLAPDWSEAYLYSEDGKPILDRQGNHLVALPKTLLKSALADYEDGDAEKVRQQNELREQQLRRTARLSEEAMDRIQKRGHAVLPLARGGEFNKELLDERKVLTIQDRLLLDDYDPEKELAAQRRRLTLRKENDTSTED